MTPIRFPTSGGDYVDDGERLRLACAAEALPPEFFDAQAEAPAAPDVAPEPVPAVPRKTGRKSPLIRTDEE